MPAFISHASNCMAALGIIKNSFFLFTLCSLSFSRLPSFSLFNCMYNCSCYCTFLSSTTFWWIKLCINVHSSPLLFPISVHFPMLFYQPTNTSLTTLPISGVSDISNRVLTLYLFPRCPSSLSLHSHSLSLPFLHPFPPVPFRGSGSWDSGGY